MICPKCGAEFRWYVTVCPDCDEDLVERLPGPEPDAVDLVQVFSTRDAALVPLAKSLLEAESIESFVRGENLQDLFGGGGMAVVGPAEFWVRAEDAERARSLLDELMRVPSPGPPESGQEE